MLFRSLPPDPACAHFHESDSRVRTVSRSQVRQPVNARGLGRWRRNAQDLAPLIAELERAGALDGWENTAQALLPEVPATSGAIRDPSSESSQP